jgi:hypothetical protein
MELDLLSVAKHNPLPFMQRILNLYIPQIDHASEAAVISFTKPFWPGCTTVAAVK